MATHMFYESELLKRSTAAALSEQIRRLGEYGDKLASLKLEDELASIFNSVLTTPHACALLSRLGWSGGPRLTLEEAGEITGVTRERMRQLEKKAIQQLRSARPLWAPVLMRAIREIEESLPLPVDQVGRLLCERGISKSEAFSGDGLVLAADMLGLSFPATVIVGSGQRFYARPGQQHLVQSVAQHARKLANNQGLAQIRHVTLALGNDGVSTSDREVERVVRGLDWPVWLSDDWFTTSLDKRNPLESRARKMATLQPGLPLALVRQGLLRDDRAYAPPTQVLRTFFAHHSDFALKDDGLWLCETPTLEAVLSDIELEFNQIFNAFGPVLDFRTLRDICVDLGMSGATATVYIATNPLIRKLARETYTMLGQAIEPGMVDPTTRRRTRTFLSAEWTTSGSVVLRYRLSEGALRCGVLGVPSSLKAGIAGSYCLIDAGGVARGTLTTRNGSLWGYRGCIAASDAVPGGELKLELDIARKTARATCQPPALGELIRE